MGSTTGPPAHPVGLPCAAWVSPAATTPPPLDAHGKRCPTALGGLGTPPSLGSCSPPNPNPCVPAGPSTLRGAHGAVPAVLPTALAC